MSQPPADTPALDEEVLGFRQWVVSDDLELTSTAVGGAWRPGVNTAECRRHDMDVLLGIYSAHGAERQRLRQLARRHHAPEQSCGCGFYALHAPTFWYGEESTSLAAALAFSMTPRHREYVAGLVAAWGKIEVHRTGFRAAHVRIVAIAIPDSPRAAVVARAVAAKYKVPTVPQNELERVAGEFGRPIPESMRPEASRETDAESYLRSAFVQVKGTGAWQHVGYASSVHFVVDESGKPEGRNDQRAAKEVEKVRERHAHRYDPWNWVPKRKGGKR